MQLKFKHQLYMYNQQSESQDFSRRPNTFYHFWRCHIHPHLSSSLCLSACSLSTLSNNMSRWPSTCLNSASNFEWAELRVESSEVKLATVELRDFLSFLREPTSSSALSRSWRKRTIGITVQSLKEGSPELWTSYSERYLCVQSQHSHVHTIIHRHLNS